MDGGGHTHARTRDRAAEAAPDGEAGRRRSHAPEAGQRRRRLHAPDGEAGWGRREAARVRRGGQKATAQGGGTHRTGRLEGDGARRSHAPDDDGGGRFGLSAGLDQTVNSHVETMMLTDAPLLYTPGQVNQLHLPGMKEMRHANRKLKHCLDPSSHDEHKKYPLFCSIDKNQFYYGVIIITRRKAPSLIISMLLC
ncbi:uncharacterized protein LOC125537408 [Triticum urartu]|nr:uncharacterized protein LOC125537408 [Triticum urartu]XP_048556673.1 uncharacterized protein LOC125537408 [Triticum urartu]XP_048556674.1 uncharacterized protein LOC125537408 [Triticum urartu]XP_048556675.1 uncharacterized protein LOC125537408 [Triticum urartu]XP_048556676.1 uncharacterized protein LOC125537408 [Triticum urartu]XP_048556677.1 uncharacterized protein LOC125537408 [Triticum urartu]XP_048556678.1 uncharacterized protein LOC125537408 [Triticum urartu]XP_048556679.1 uncharacte